MKKVTYYRNLKIKLESSKSISSGFTVLAIDLQYLLVIVILNNAIVIQTNRFAFTLLYNILNNWV